MCHRLHTLDTHITIKHFSVYFDSRRQQQRNWWPLAWTIIWSDVRRSAPRRYELRIVLCLSMMWQYWLERTKWRRQWKEASGASGVASSIAARCQHQPSVDQCLFGSRGLPIWKAVFRVEIGIKRATRDATMRRPPVNEPSLTQPPLSVFYVALHQHRNYISCLIGLLLTRQLLKYLPLLKL